MSLRFLRLCVATCLAASLPLHAQTPAPTPAAPTSPGVRSQPDGDRPVSLVLPEGDLDSVLKALEGFTGRIVLRPNALPTTTYNLMIPDPIPVSEMVLAIETVLTLNNIGVVPLGDRFLKVVPLQIAKTEAPELIGGTTLDLAPSGRVATKIFVFDFLRVEEIQGQLQGMLSPNIGGGIVPMPKANAALITDTVSNLQRIEILLKELDRPATANLRPKFYPLREAKASDLVNKLNMILGNQLRQQLGAATTFQPDDRTNQVILISDPRQHAFFDELIEKLDVRADPNTRNQVIYLKHAEAEKVATILTTLVGQQISATQRSNAQSVRPGTPRQPSQPTQPVQPGQLQPAPLPQPTVMQQFSSDGDSSLGGGGNEFSALVSIQADARSNAIIISGTGDDIRLITELVEKLDIILDQVRIEVVIVEVTLSDQATSGISALGLRVQGDKLTGFSGAFPGMGISGLGNEPFASVTRPSIPAEGETPVLVTGPWDLAGQIALTTSPRKNNTSILSVPNIVTTHNQAASVFVGEKRQIISAVTSDASTTSGSRSTYQPTEIGITLQVLPLIGRDGSVQLKVEQNVEEVIDEVILEGNVQPIIGTRRTDSFVTVMSGETIVLGGLQRQRRGRQTNRLGPIPIIGDLLGLRRRETTRTELIFFLRPYVLTNTPADNVEALQRLEGLPQRDAIHKALDPEYVPEPRGILDRLKK